MLAAVGDHLGEVAAHRRERAQREQLAGVEVHEDEPVERSPLDVERGLGLGGEQANGASFDPQVSYPMGAWGGYDEHGRFVAFTSSASTCSIQNW